MPVVVATTRGEWVLKLLKYLNGTEISQASSQAISQSGSLQGSIE